CQLAAGAADTGCAGRTAATGQDRIELIAQDAIRLGRDGGPSRARDASSLSAASRAQFYFAWGCFRDLCPGPATAPAPGHEIVVLRAETHKSGRTAALRLVGLTPNVATVLFGADRNG